MLDGSDGPRIWPGEGVLAPNLDRVAGLLQVSQARATEHQRLRRSHHLPPGADRPRLATATLNPTRTFP